MSDFDDNWHISGLPDLDAPVEAVPKQPFLQKMQQQQAAQPQYQAQQVVRPQYQAQQARPQYQTQQGRPQYQQPMYRAPYGGYAQSAMQSTYFAAERNANLVECNKLMKHFSAKSELYKNYEACYSEIRKRMDTNVAPLTFGIIVLAVAAFLIYYTFSSRHKDTILTYGIISAIITFIGASLVALFFILKFVNKKKLNEKFEELGKMSTELSLLYNGYSNCVLPPEYTDPKIIMKIQYLLASGRCINIGDSLKYLLSFGNSMRLINAERPLFNQVTSERFGGQTAFFNAVRFMNLR